MVKRKISQHSVRAANIINDVVAYTCIIEFGFEKSYLNVKDSKKQKNIKNSNQITKVSSVQQLMKNLLIQLKRIKTARQ